MRTREIKREAKTQLSGNWKIAILNLFLVGVLTAIINEVLLGIFGAGSISSLISTFSQDALMMEEAVVSPGPAIFSTFLSFAVGVITSIFMIGYNWSMLDMIDGEKLTVEKMFQSLQKNRVFKVLGMAFVVNIFVFLWSLLLIIPGFIKSISYSQTFNLYKDDPELDIMSAINQSKEIMSGKKWAYFKLQLSFILWYLIPTLLLMAFFIGSINTIGNQIEQAYMSTGAEVLGFFLGMLFILLAYILVMVVISFYVEPYRVTATQIFYRDLVGFPEEPLDAVEYDDYSTDSVENIDPYESNEDRYSNINRDNEDYRDEFEDDERF